MRITTGFPDGQRERAAELFWEAFSGKLGRVLRPETRALAFIEQALTPAHAISALSDSGELIGLAGLKTTTGGLVTAGRSEVAQIYGRLGALWRAAVLDRFEHRLTDRQVLVDGLFVASQARGRGVGSALIEAVLREAQWRGFDEVRLAVADGNPRARALYERHGFSPAERADLGPYAWLFGFRHTTTMQRWLVPR